MPRRPSSASAAILLALLAAGCQDYNFNPVGHCLIQPGSERVTLSDLATADILFVVDDSGSMESEQQALAANFEKFVNVLTQTNAERVQEGLAPLDFHIAITSTSVYQATNSGFCRSDCQDSTGGLACCAGAGLPVVRDPVFCSSDAECGTGNTCKLGCTSPAGQPGYGGDFVCCTPSNVVELRDPVPCTEADAQCGVVRDHFRGTMGGTSCVAGVATPGAPYPQGDFVAASGNPRVISFGKDLYPATGPDQAAIASRIAEFQENIVVGTCGSGTEQGLEASRLALQKALKQAGLTQPAGAEGWPHQDAKLVVVYVGDEDDCSAPSDDPVYDASKCATDTTKRFPLQEYVDFFLGLGRPFSAAVIESTNPTDPTTPQVCCASSSGGCDGSETPGTRFVTYANDLVSRQVDVVEGSICADFGTLLGQVAELVKPPNTLTLPTMPVASEVTVLRIVAEGGLTRKTCNGPAPATMTFDQAVAAGYDWWFVAGSSGTAPTTLSQYVYINHGTRSCEANPGETYSADYLGVVPEGGVASAAECAQVLGGAEANWTWEAVPGLTRDGTTQLGTCICQ